MTSAKLEVGTAYKNSDAGTWFVHPHNGEPDIDTAIDVSEPFSAILAKVDEVNTSAAEMNEVLQLLGIADDDDRLFPVFRVIDGSQGASLGLDDGDEFAEYAGCGGR